MKTVVGERGQITIPKAIRDRLGIRPGQRLDVEERDGAVLARKAQDDDPVAEVYGILRLPAPVDQLIDEMRGPAELPPDE